MATITLTPLQAVRGGLTNVFTASGASPLLNVVDTFVFNNTGHEVLQFRKTGAGACTVTITTPNTVDGLAIADRTNTVPATTGDVTLGPYPPGDYNTPGTSTFAGFTVSEVTGLSLMILRI
jgi:hypothetical protein